MIECGKGTALLWRRGGGQDGEKMEDARQARAVVEKSGVPAVVCGLCDFPAAEYHGHCCVRDGHMEIFRGGAGFLPEGGEYFHGPVGIGSAEGG